MRTVENMGLMRKNSNELNRIVAVNSLAVGGSVQSHWAYFVTTMEEKRKRSEFKKKKMFSKSTICIRNYKNKNK